MRVDRGQIHTLEAFLAALLIVGALLFATQATAVTPLSASTANQHIENQHESVAEDLLRLTANDGSLQEAMLYWNVSDGQFDGAPENMSAYTGTPPDGNPLNDSLRAAFGTGELAYNIELRHHTADGDDAVQPMFEMGSPSDHAVTATRTVNLYETDTLTSTEYEGEQLTEVEDFWAENVDEDAALYNSVEVRITVWRM